MPLTLTNRDIDVLEQSVQLATTNGEDAYTIPTTTLRALFETVRDLQDEVRVLEREAAALTDELESR